MLEKRKVVGFGKSAGGPPQGSGVAGSSPQPPAQLKEPATEQTTLVAVERDPKAVAWTKRALRDAGGW